MKCLVIAAGKGTRLQGKGDSKPLIPLLGVPLIERVIRLAMKAGADDFYVVTGYRADLVRAFLERLSTRLNTPITVLFNEDWEGSNGLSVLAAREYLSEPFLLLMADHVFDPAIAVKLMMSSPADDRIVLAVDTDAASPLVDVEDVTRVLTDDSVIREIGKELADFDAFDTGVFLCTPTIFDAVRRSSKEHGDTTLSGAVRMLAHEGRADVLEIEGRFWVDIDDPAAFRRAESALLASLRDKPSDGPVSRYLNRPVSVMISRHLANHRITPNQVSLFSFLSSMVAAGLFALGGYPALLLGGFLAQFASVIDGCDGEVARLTFQTSDYGGWFDAVLDRYADAFLLFGFTWHVYASKASGVVLLIGFLAIIGSFMLSYTADKYDGLMRQRIGGGRGVRLGRDVRVFFVFLGAVANQVLLTLVVIAIVMNGETMRRLVACRDHG